MDGYYFQKHTFEFQELLFILTGSQSIRFLLLNFLFYQEYKIPLLPRTDFTQLRMSGKYFFKSSIVLLNYKTPFFIAAVLLGAIAMSSLHLLLLWAFVGCALVHQLGISGILTFNECNRDAIKEQFLKMGIGGTLMGLTWVGLGIGLSNKIPHATISLWWMIPIFIILLFTCVQLPLLHALLKVKKDFTNLCAECFASSHIRILVSFTARNFLLFMDFISDGYFTNVTLQKSFI